MDCLHVHGEPVDLGKKESMSSIFVSSKHVGGCPNYGPFLNTLNIRRRAITGTLKGTIILTTTHVTSELPTVIFAHIAFNVGKLCNPPQRCCGCSRRTTTFIARAKTKQRMLLSWQGSGFGVQG